jgi:hypothetical protein
VFIYIAQISGKTAQEENKKKLLENIKQLSDYIHTIISCTNVATAILFPKFIFKNVLSKITHVLEVLLFQYLTSQKVRLKLD